MKKLLAILLLAASSAFAQQPPADLDIRITALTQEYEATIAAQARRSATLASELAAVQAKLKADQGEIERLKKLCGKPCEPEKK